MKKLFSFLLIIFFTQQLQAQWVQIPSGTFENLNAVQFPDANTGYAVGNAGIVLKTTNGGQNWSLINTGLTFDNLSLFFINPNTGYINNQNFSLMHTTNGGSNWTITSSPFNRTVYFLNQSTGFGADEYIYGSLYKTTNGGVNWTSSVSYSSKYVEFLNATFGYSVHNIYDNGYIRHVLHTTTNTGINWNYRNVYTADGKNLNSANFITTTIGYVAGDSGTIYKTSNGGINWIFQTSNTSNSFKSIKVTDLSAAIVVGNSGTIKATSNGGATWYSQNSTTANNLNSLSMVNTTTGFIVGDVGTILKTTTGGVGITRLESNVPNNYSLSQNYPNPFNPTTKIRFDLQKNSFTKLTIYDITGKVIDELINSELQSGAYEITWDATNYSSGGYFYRVETSGFVDMKRMVLVK